MQLWRYKRLSVVQRRLVLRPHGKPVGAIRLYRVYTRTSRRSCCRTSRRRNVHLWGSDRGRCRPRRFGCFSHQFPTMVYFPKHGTLSFAALRSYHDYRRKDRRRRWRRTKPSSSTSQRSINDIHTGYDEDPISQRLANSVTISESTGAAAT